VANNLKLLHSESTIMSSNNTNPNTELPDGVHGINNPDANVNVSKSLWSTCKRKLGNIFKFLRSNPSPAADTVSTAASAASGIVAAAAANAGSIVASAAANSIANTLTNAANGVAANINNNITAISGFGGDNFCGNDSSSDPGGDNAVGDIIARTQQSIDQSSGVSADADTDSTSADASEQSAEQPDDESDEQPDDEQSDEQSDDEQGDSEAKSDDDSDSGRGN